MALDWTSDINSINSGQKECLYWQLELGGGCVSSPNKYLTWKYLTFNPENRKVLVELNKKYISFSNILLIHI